MEPREGHNWISNQSTWSGSSDPSYRPAHSVAACFLRLPPFRGRCSSAKLSAGSLFYRLVQSCRRLLSTSTVCQAPFGCRCSSGTVLFLYLIIFFNYSVSPVCPFLPLLFASGLRSEKRLFFFSFVAFLMQFPAVSISCTYCVTNVTYSLGLGLRVSCPILPVSLPFPRGSVPTLFDPTIYVHFNIFKSPTKLQSSRFQRAPFPLGRAYKYAACIFCNTWFQIPCWQIVHVHINIIMARFSYSSPPFNTKIHCKLVYIYVYGYMYFFMDMVLTECSYS